MAGRADFNRGKFNELVLLLTERSRDDERMSRVKLNKLLYRCDFESFRLLGSSMTGATYLKGEHGPMAAELPLAETELGARGYLGWTTPQSGSFTRKVPVAIEKADVSQFSDAELAIVSTSLDELGELGARGASRWSHEESAGWRVKGDGEEITYESGLIETAPLDESRVGLLREYVQSLSV